MSRSRPLLALVVVFLVEGLIAGSSLVTNWDALRRRGQVATDQGQGLVIGSDGLGYYAWLRSLLLDGDWDFDNEFDHFNPLKNGVLPPGHRTPLGRRWNQWSVGPACVWSVGVVPCHLAVTLLQPHGLPWPADGYSLPYQLAVALTTFLAGALGLGWIYRAGRHLAAPDAAALAAAVLVLGTTLAYYWALEPSMAHGVAAAALAGLVAAWLPGYGDGTPRRWWRLGLWLGLVGLMRWQLLTNAVLIVGEALLTWPRHGLRRTVANLARAGVAAVAALMPQLVAWRCVFGQWLVAPVPVAPHWAEPSMEAVLWGPDRSLFAWTPAAGLALLLAAGSLAVAARRPGRVQPLALLLIAFLVQVYVLASVWGVVYLGASFGLRHLTESLVLLAPGMALALGHLSKWGRRLAGGLGVALAAWNLLLVCQFRYGFVPTEAGAPLTTLLANAWWMARHRQPLVLSHAILGPLLVALACRPAGTRVAPLSLRSSRVARRKQGAKQCVVSS